MGVFEHIVDYLPLPRMWQWHLTRLSRRCDLIPQVAIIELCGLMDEVLTDMCIFKGNKQADLMLQLARSPEVNENHYILYSIQ